MLNFEVSAYLVKVKEGEDFNHRNPAVAGLNISSPAWRDERNVPPRGGRRKGAFCKDLMLNLMAIGRGMSSY